MKQIFLLTSLSLSMVWFLVGAGPDVEEFGKITLPLGKVSVQSGGTNEWKRALPNRKVFEGDRVRTREKSRCEITLSGGGKVRLGENSLLEIDAVNIKPLEKNFNSSLKKGNVWVSVKAAFSEKKNVSIRTPTAVAAIRGTKYRAVADSSESSVLVYSGKVDVNAVRNVMEKQQEERKSIIPEDKPGFKLGPVEELEAPSEVPGPYEVSLEDWITLVEGMQINIRKDGKYNLFKFDQTTDAELDFVKWNKELDARP